jgi:uncharacterized protein (DUF342 family)
LLVACGRPAQNGEASVFVSLVPQVPDRHPLADEHGVIDYRDFGRIVGVSPGDPLMRRTPATAGSDGYDVTGRVLRAKPGKSVPYATRLKGVTVDAQDPELLRAAISGRAVQVANGVTVESTIELPCVDMSTGNIDFDGSVTVLGDVTARMKIRATGDVLVRGTVSAADIEAGGQVVLQGGLLGARHAHDDKDDVSPHEGAIRCTGSFHARFVEYARVESGGDILVDDHALYSTLIAARHVVVGGGGTKGQILGGTVRAIGQVTAQKYGGPSGVSTLVDVGLDVDHRARLARLEAEIEMLAAGPENAAAVERIRTEAARLKAQLELADHACVSVGRTVYPGTQIRIGGKSWSARDEHPGGVFRLAEGKVVRCPR